MPDGWEWDRPNAKDRKPVITYKKYDSYNDYVLENALYTNVKEYDEVTDENPNFVNQYLTFDDKTTPELPALSQQEPKEAPKVVSKPEVTATKITIPYKNNDYEVDMEAHTITNVKSGKIIDPTSSVGVNVLKSPVLWTMDTSDADIAPVKPTVAQAPKSKPTVKKEVKKSEFKGPPLPPIDSSNPWVLTDTNFEGVDGMENYKWDDPMNGGSTFNNAFSTNNKTASKPKVQVNKDPKDKKQCQIAPKGQPKPKGGIKF